MTLTYPADEAVGITSRYTVGARRLAVKAGTITSFDRAAEHLEESCGIKLSDNTIRDLCQKEAVPMGRWQRTNPAANADFIAAEGDVEFTTDGTCVNTTEGWREMRVGIFAKRERGESVHPDQWAERKLPKPHTLVAFAGIENKETFRKHWEGRAKRLGVADEMISVLGDGAHWIWDAAALTPCLAGVPAFAKRDEVLDVYHGLENVSDCGKVLCGSGTEEYKTWQDETTLELLWNGYELTQVRQSPPASKNFLRIFSCPFCRERPIFTDFRPQSGSIRHGSPRFFSKVDVVKKSFTTIYYCPSQKKLAKF